MTCNACKLDHPALMRCEVARRLAVANTFNVSVANEDGPSVVANRSVDGMRVELWRQANRERYNARMKDYMKKRRANLGGV